MDIPQFLERAVQFFPNAIACVAGETRLTYGTLQARVNRLANALQQHGVSKGDRVAVLSTNSLPDLEMYYATAALGALIVPLNFRLASCGRAVPGTRVRVVNEYGEDVQPGEVGEIIAHGPNITRGYWNKPEETAAAFSQRVVLHR